MSLITELSRRLSGRPGPMLVTLAVLGVGTAAASVMFTVVDAAQFRALPFRDGERLMLVSHRPQAAPAEWHDLTARDTVALAARDDVFESFGYFQHASITLGDATGAERFPGARVSAGFFTRLGTAPALGRDLTASDFQPGAPRALLLSDEVWRTRFDADPGVLGRAVRVNQQDGVVVGVMPPGFGFPSQERLWMPVDEPAGAVHREIGERYIAFAHLRPGFSTASAEAALADTWAALVQDAPVVHAEVELGIRPVAYFFVDPQMRAFQWAMLIAVLGLLAIAVANAAAISAAEALGRQHELALRAALGASRGRLLRDEALQALALGLCAALLALAASEVALGALQRAAVAAEDPMPYWLEYRLTWRTAGFALLLALLAALGGRLLPAWSVAGLASGLALREGERGASGRGFLRTSGWLLALQLALSVSLVVGTALLARAITEIWTRDIGAEPRGVLTARLALHGTAYDDAATRRDLLARLAPALSRIPGVQAAGISAALPGSIHNRDAVVTGPVIPGEALPEAAWGAADEGALAALGMRLRAGRWFDARDTADSLPVAVVDANFVAAHWPGQDALGRQVRMEPDDPTSPWRTVVGVLEPVLLAEVDDPARPALFMPLSQNPRRFVTVVLRAAGGEPLALAAGLRSTVQGLDPELPLYWVRSHEDAIAHGRSTVELIAALFTAFGAIALLLAAAGTYGVVSASIGRRTRELGIRRALGAQGFALVRAAASGTLLRAGLGVAAGCLLAVPAGQGLAGLASGLRFDLGLMLVVVAVVALTVLVGLIAPVRRALAVDPMVVLREE